MKVATEELRSIGWILLVGLLAYGSALGNGFHYDDSHSILENSHLRSLENAGRFFVDSSTFSGLVDVRMYRPLLVLSLAINYAIGQYDPIGYHLVNVAFHLINAVLVWRLAQAVGLSRSAALIAGLLFVAHPVLSEPVNYISSRSSLMATCFVTWAFLLHVQGRSTLWVAAAYLAALLSKSSAIVFPVLVLIWGMGQPRSVRRWSSLVVTLALSVLYVGGTRAIVGKALLQPVRDHVVQWATQSKALVFYLFKAWAPFSLSIEPQFAVSTSFGEGVVLVALALLCSIAFIAVRGLRGVALLGVGWFVVALLPPSLVPLNVLVNEHRLYLPMVGGALALAQCVGCVRSFPRVAWCGLVAMVALCAQRNLDWRTSESIWRDAVDKGPYMARPYVNWSQALLETGRVEESIAASRRALDLQPTLERAHYNLGTAYMHRQEYELAEAHLQRALDLDDELIPAHNNLGNLYQEQGQYDRALLHYGRALSLQPHPSLLHNVGNAHLQAGRYDSAGTYFRRALALDATMREGYKGLFSALRGEERLNEAIQILQEALRHWPRDEMFSLLMAETYAGMGRDLQARAVYRQLGKSPAEQWALLGSQALRRGNWQRAHDALREALQSESGAALYNDLGAALIGLGKMEEGLQAFREAARIDPERADPFANIGRVYLQHGRYTDAVAALHRAAQLDGQNGDICALLGQAYERVGKPDVAREWYQRAVDRSPQVAAYRTNLACMYQALGQTAEAERLFRSALERDRQNEPTLFNLGVLLLDTGRPHEALVVYRQLVALAPGHVDGQINLASAYVATGDKSAAAAVYRLLLAGDLPDTLRRQVLEQVAALAD